MSYPIIKIYDEVINDVESDQENLEEVLLEEDFRVEDLPIFVEMHDGSLAPIESLRYNQDEHNDTSTDEEVQHARENVYRAMSPLTPVGLPQHREEPLVETVRFRIEQVEPARGRGRGRAGRGRGRGLRGGRRGSRWLRGEPLVERFVSDQDLPISVRENISQILADRNRRRERDVRRRSAANDVLEEEGSNVENAEEAEFFDAEEFVWEPMDERRGSKETFLPESSGPTAVFDSAYDTFRSYWDDYILTHIVTETNRYAQGIQSVKFKRSWYETNVDEMLILFAFWMMLGIIKMPSIKSCYSKIPMLRTDIFRHLLTETRYWNINRSFHLANGSRDPNNPDNVLYPMGPIINHLNEKFQQNYRLGQDICIDESLTLWKGPVGFMQYIKTKAAKFGIKTYQLCESSTGYLWSFFVYVGRRTTNSNLPSSVSTILRLMQPLLNLGHVLYMDNWFNSPALARFLKRRHTDCVGTLRSSRKHVPLELQRAPLAEGEFIARRSGDVTVVTLQDRRRLSCISTFHDMTQVQTPSKPGRPSQHKLKLIEDYNRGMGGVDRLDQMLEPYLVERKQCVKWTKKLFKRFLNISIQNSRVLLERSSNTKVDSLAFRLALVQEIIDKHLCNVPSRSTGLTPKMRYPGFPVNRLTERHFIHRIPITDEMRQMGQHRTNVGRRRCVWCTYQKRPNSRTVYECSECKMPLCLDRCFKEFHTIP